jgi:glutathione S-transferase
MLKLYYAPNTCALAAHIALEDAGADYEAHRLDFYREEQRQTDYLAINPKGRVPALSCPEGLLTENPAILAYIAQTHKAANLAPLEDAFAFAKIQAFNNYLASTLHVAHAHGKRAERWADDEAAKREMLRKMPEVVLNSFLLIEEDMFKGPFVMGEAYTICDPYLFTFAQWMEADNVDPDLLPKLRDHRQMMLQRPNVQKIIADERAAD